MKNLKKIDQFLKVLSDPTRMRILKLLENRKMCVCEIAEILKQTQPNISKHLKKLKNSGIIDSEQSGYWSNYYLLKQENLYFDNIFKNLTKVLNNEGIIEKDKKNAKKVDRNKVC